MTAMKKTFVIGVALTLLACPVSALAQKDKEVEPTSWIYFFVVKDDNGKPVRNAAVILHAVGSKGNQERGGLELKTDPDGKTNYDGIPYGKLRVQILAHGFQTFGEDYNIDKPKVEITIKLKRPQGQYSVYDDRTPDSTAPAKDASGQQEKKPN
jgi:Carboxypeptidase regulatory-like domain